MESSVPISQVVVQPQGIPMHGPGGAKLQNVLVNMTAAAAQQGADGVFDPKVTTQGPTIIHSEGFCSSSHSSMIAVVGALCIVYGMIAK